MRALARFCIRIGFLPGSPRFARWISRQLFVPLHPRDQAAGMSGYFELGEASPRAVKRFRDWWRTNGG
ncbi:MAG TPA: hypothetical protein VLD58_11195 [Gemmatimonadales bacterium]|nr:hypothetical protein [Gemmatimonadales bacterium]